MSRRQPTLGYPSKSAAALALWRQGLLQREIATQLNVKPGTVGALISHAKSLERGTRQQQLQVTLDKTSRMALANAAIACGIDANTLLQRLLRSLPQAQTQHAPEEGKQL